MGKSTPQKRALGRGLGALIVNTEMQAPEIDAPPAPVDNSGVRLLALNTIQPNPQQPRTQFDEQALQELAASIRTHGIIQPLIVTGNPQQPGYYWLVAGERRWRAAHLAELPAVPALVREASRQELMELALIENVQRADLNPLEEAVAYQALLTEFRLTHADIATRVGKSRSAISNTLRLLELPLTIQEALTSNRISAGHARALLALTDQATMQTALAEITEQELSVRQTEALVKRLLTPSRMAAVEEPPSETAAPAQLAYLENRFRTALGTRVQLNRNPNGSGRLVVHFYNDEDLDQLYKLIAQDKE